MTQEQWETVEVPRGAYISWGETPGVQEVVGKVIDYSYSGGTDFAGHPCPQVSLELRAPTFSVNKAGQRSEHQIGDLVIMNAGLVSLKRAVMAMQMQPGDLIKISFARVVPTSNGTVKEFDVQIARGAGKTAGPPQAPAQPPQQQYAPPPPPPQQYAPPPQQPQPQYQPGAWAQPQVPQPANAGGYAPQAQPPF
jgi:hypothetical protein